MLRIQRTLAAALLGLWGSSLAGAQDLYAGAADGALLRGHPVTGDFQVVASCQGPIHSMCFDGRDVLIGDTAGRIYRYRPSTDTLTQPFTVANDARALALYTGAQGTELHVGGRDGTVLRVDKDTGDLLGTIQVGVPVDALLYENGRLYVGSSAGILATYDFEHGGTVTWCPAAVRIKALQTDDTHLIAADRGRIFRISHVTHVVEATFSAPNDAAAIVLHAGQLLVAGSDGAIHRVDRTHGGIAATLHAAGDIGALAIEEQADPGQTYCSGNDCPCGNNDPTAGCRNSTGAGSRLRASGTASVVADDLFLAATQLPLGQACLFYAGAPARGTPFGDGLLCTSTAHPLRFSASTSGPSGSVLLGPGIVQHTLHNMPPAKHILPGQT